MKILMINVVCGIRSTGRICTDLATALEEQGHEVKIAYGREEVPEQFQKYAVRVGNDLDVKLHALKARLFDAAGFGSKEVTKKFIKWVKEYDPDVIHLHNIHGYYINIEVLFDYLRTCGKKVIWTLHDCWAFTGHAAFCEAANCDRWISGCHDCPNITEYPASMKDHSSLNWQKKKNIMNHVPNLSIVTPSCWLADLVQKSFLSQYTVSVIHNGIDLNCFYPMKNDFREFYGIEDKFILLGVVRESTQTKDISGYLKIAEMIGDDCQIVLFGVSTGQKESLPANITGIEPTDSVKELHHIYSSADLFIDFTNTENIHSIKRNNDSFTYPIMKDVFGPGLYGSIDKIEISCDEITLAVQAIQDYKISKKKTIKMDSDSNDAILMGDYRNKTKIGFFSFKDELGLIGEKVILGVAAVWDKRKGLDDIVKLNSIVDHNSKIIVVGVSEKQQKSLPSEILSYTHTNNVEELRQLYSVADVFINTTYEDNYPSTNIEAIACSTPVISYQTGGSPESAELYGVAIKQGDVVGLNEMLNMFHESLNGCHPSQEIISKKTFVTKYIQKYYS